MINLCLLACKFVSDQSERKEMRVYSSSGQSESQVDAGFWPLVQTPANSNTVNKMIPETL